MCYVLNLDVCGDIYLLKKWGEDALLEWNISKWNDEFWCAIVDVSSYILDLWFVSIKVAYVHFEKMHKWGDGIVLSYVLKLHIDNWFLFMLSPMTMLDELIGDTYWWVNGLYLNIVYIMVINMVYGGE